MKNQWKNNENQYKFGFEKTTSKTTWKYWVQDPPWLHFGGFGEAPGRHWGTPGRHDRVSWALLGASWAPLWSHGCFGLDLGRVWEALGRFLGSFGEDLNRILGRFWEDIFVSETPALSRQLAWRPNFALKIERAWRDEPGQGICIWTNNLKFILNLFGGHSIPPGSEWVGGSVGGGMGILFLE